MFQAAAAVTKIRVSTPMLATCWLVNTSGKPQAASRTTASPARRSAGAPSRFIGGVLGGRPPRASPVTVSPARLRGALETPPSLVARRFAPHSSVQAAPRPSGSLCPRLLAAEQALRPEREHHHERRVEHGHRPG